MEDLPVDGVFVAIAIRLPSNSSPASCGEAPAAYLWTEGGFRPHSQHPGVNSRPAMSPTTFTRQALTAAGLGLHGRARLPNVTWAGVGAMQGSGEVAIVAQSSDDHMPRLRHGDKLRVFTHSRRGRLVSRNCQPERTLKLSQSANFRASVSALEQESVRCRCSTGHARGAGDDRNRGDPVSHRQ